MAAIVDPTTEIPSITTKNFDVKRTFSQSGGPAGSGHGEGPGPSLPPLPSGRGTNDRRSVE